MTRAQNVKRQKYQIINNSNDNVMSKQKTEF